MCVVPVHVVYVHVCVVCGLCVWCVCLVLWYMCVVPVCGVYACVCGVWFGCLVCVYVWCVVCVCGAFVCGVCTACVYLQGEKGWGGRERPTLCHFSSWYSKFNLFGHSSGLLYHRAPKAVIPKSHVY